MLIEELPRIGMQWTLHTTVSERDSFPLERFLT